MNKTTVDDFINLLVKKSKEKKSLWNKGSRHNQFHINLPNGLSASIYDYTANSRRQYMFTVMNADGETIVRRDSEDLMDNEMPYLNLESLQILAHEIYYKVDETIDGLLNELRDKDTIGDDLPF